jgi:hypothetical protein
MSYIFIVFILYYLLFFDRLNKPLISRDYKDHLTIILDLLYYFSQVIFIIWSISLLFINVDTPLVICLFITTLFLMLSKWSGPNLKVEMSILILRTMILLLI